MDQPLDQTLQELEPRLSRILRISGLPGCSIGVIHGGQVWKCNLGFRDVENKLPPQSDTLFFMNSLTKGIVAAAFACLVQDGKITWKTPINNIIPEFSNGGDALDQDINALDLLSMRSGHKALNCMSWQGSSHTLPLREDTIKYWNASPRPFGFRSSFIYNNWGYAVIALVIEKLAQQPLHQYLKQRIFDPLRLKRTKMQDSEASENKALSYAALSDRSPVPVPDQNIGVGTFCEGAGGLMSTVDDMLSLYSSYLDAINDQFASKTTSTANNPFVQCTTLLAPHTLLGVESVLREQSYACGWIRAQLPGPLGMIGINKDYGTMPNLLEGAKSSLCLYHQGIFVGSTSNITLIPETETVIVILANAAPLGDCTDWISQIILEALFEPSVRLDFESLAEDRATKVLDHIPSLGRELAARRVPGTHPSHPIDAYAGTFVEENVPFKIHILLSGPSGGLLLRFAELETETYELRHYQNDTFSWQVNS